MLNVGIETKGKNCNVQKKLFTPKKQSKTYTHPYAISAVLSGANIRKI